MLYKIRTSMSSTGSRRTWHRVTVRTVSYRLCGGKAANGTSMPASAACARYPEVDGMGAVVAVQGAGMGTVVHEVSVALLLASKRAWNASGTRSPPAPGCHPQQGLRAKEYFPAGWGNGCRSAAPAPRRVPRHRCGSPRQPSRGPGSIWPGLLPTLAGQPGRCPGAASPRSSSRRIRRSAAPSYRQPNAQGQHQPGEPKSQGIQPGNAISCGFGSPPR